MVLEKIKGRAEYLYWPGQVKMAQRAATRVFQFLNPFLSLYVCSLLNGQHSKQAAQRQRLQLRLRWLRLLLRSEIFELVVFGQSLRQRAACSSRPQRQRQRTNNHNSTRMSEGDRGDEG